MPHLAMKMEKRYTYSDFMTWPDEECWEIINGIPYAMSPAPSRKHQAMVLELSRLFANHIKEQGGSCKVYIAPFDVRLPEGSQTDDQIETVVQPDIVIVCDNSKLDDKGCKGSPDMVVEIASPSTVRRDMSEKLRLYEHHGVREYWLVLPGEQAVSVYSLDERQQYGKPEVYTPADEAPVRTMDGLTVKLADMFAAE